MSDDLLDLFLRDREAHESPPMPGTPAYVALRTADAGRRSRVRQIADTGALRSGEDYYRAAMILQHGDDPADFDQARVWALQAAELGHRPARWLAAAALDRSLMVRGKPQKFGTQIVPDGVRQRVWDIDPATTDSDRAEWDVPPLAEMHRRAEKVTASEAMPDMAEAPRWLLDAVERWRSIEKGSGRATAWVVWRTDDNGNDVEVERLFGHEEAVQRAAELERKGHKQTYWVARG